jgi:hypothetical protein
MNDHAMYELAKIRHAEMIAERTRLGPVWAARRKRRRGLSVGRERFARGLHRLADRIEPAARPTGKLTLPGQRRLHRA